MTLLTISKNAAGRFVAHGHDADGGMEIEADYLTIDASARAALAPLFTDGKRKEKEPEKEIAGVPPVLGGAPQSWIDRFWYSGEEIPSRPY